MGLGAFIGVGKSLETALQRVELAERLGYESAYVTHIAGATRSPADGLRRAQRAACGWAPASRRSTAARRSRRPSRSPRSTSSRAAARSSAWAFAPARRRGLVRPDDRQAAARDARVRRDRAGDPARRGPAAGREVPSALPLHGLRAAAGHPDLPGRPLPRHAAPRRRDRRRRGPLAVQPRLHPRRRGADGRRGPRQGRQAARRASTSSRRCRRRSRASPSRPRPAALRADPLLLAALLPQDVERSGYGDDIAAFDRGMRRAGRGRPGRISDGFLVQAGRDRQRRGGRGRRCAATRTAARPRRASAASRGRTSTPRSKRSPARSAEREPEVEEHARLRFAPRWG